MLWNILTCMRHDKNLLVCMNPIRNIFYQCFNVLFWSRSWKRKLNGGIIMLPNQQFLPPQKGSKRMKNKIKLYMPLWAGNNNYNNITCVFGCVKSKNISNQQKQTLANTLFSLSLSTSLRERALHSMHMLVWSTLTIHIPKSIAVCLREFACYSRH